MADKTTAPTPPAQRGDVISLEVAAALLMLTPQWVMKLARDGFIPRPERNTYTIQGCVQGYIRYLKDEARRTSKSAQADRVATQRAKEIAQRIAKNDNQLIDINDAQAVVDEIVGIYRSEYSGLGVACTRDGRMRETIEGQVDQTQKRVEARLAKRLAALRSGGSTLEADPEDDA